MKTGIVYNVEIARNEAFAGVSKKIDISTFSIYKIDVARNDNLKVLKNGQRKYKGKLITLYSNGDYSIKYLDNKMYSFFYDDNGVLKILSVQTTTKYPIKCVRYDITGKLDSISFSISSKEQYIFDNNGRLVAHWIGNTGYNEHGDVIGTRK